jgi:hypothetical protein
MKASVIAVALALAGAVSTAQVSQEDHSAHHPGDGAADAPAAQAAPSVAAPTAAMDAELMNKMQQMRKRMQAASTPEQRRALMDEQMKLMQSGMEMMGRMGQGQGQGMGMGAGPAAAGMAGGMGGQGAMMGMHGGMERRMAMMETMMQMMVDREAAVPRK